MSFPNGWSLKRIQQEAHRREWSGFEDLSTYHKLRDGPREQDWVWAVDAVRDELSEDAFKAAHDLYHAQQAAVGDTERQESVRVQCANSSYDMFWQWKREHYAGIAENAKSYVWAHPDRTEARIAVFRRLFDVSQPSLEDVRTYGRPGGVRYDLLGKPLRMNQREVIDRIKWCCETLAEHFTELRIAHLGPAA